MPFEIFGIFGALSFVMVVVSWVLPIALLGYLGLRFVRAYEARKESASEMRTLEARVRRLEARLESLGADVRSVAEPYLLTTRMASERALVAAARTDERPVAP